MYYFKISTLIFVLFKGNDDITQIEDGAFIRGGSCKKREFGLLKDSFQSYKNDSMWTQITIHHGKLFTKKEILDEIVPKLFNNSAFFPSYYKRYGERDEFYLYKNYESLRLLMNNDLEFVMSNQKKLTFSLRLNAAKFENGQVDWFHKINYVLAGRIKDGEVNLKNFATDPEFSKMIVPMNSKFTLNFILEQIKKQNNQITRIVITNCGINMEAIEGLQSLIQFQQIEALDLRDNNITSMARMINTTHIKNLKLDGNPICNQFSIPRDFVEEMKRYFNELEWLDGHRLDKAHNLVPLQNYIVKRDAYTIADEFVKTFFIIYDSFERPRLSHMYYEHSIFSLSINYDIDKSNLSSDTYARIQKYTKFSRNLDAMSNMNRSSDNVMVGVGCIARVFDELPKTTHDFKSICIDVPLFHSNQIVITVSGTFEEHGQSLNDDQSNFLMGFVRSFVLRLSKNNEYCITNEQLFLHNSTETQKEEWMSRRKEPMKETTFLNDMCRDLLPTEIEDKEMKLAVFQELTELKTEEAIRQLEESFYDLKVALATFNTLMLDGRGILDNKFDFK